MKEITMKIEIEDNAFEGYPNHTRVTFETMLESEIKKIAHDLQIRANMWLYHLKYNKESSEEEIHER
jgi:hypothetical protein